MENTTVIVVSPNDIEAVVINTSGSNSNTTEVYTVVVEKETSNTVTLGGARGIPGVSEEEIMYAKRVDFTSDTVLYKGEAAVGALTSSALWRVRKLILGTDGDVSETWASGDAEFNKVWDDRLSLTYT
jgi:hypothetical protein